MLMYYTVCYFTGILYAVVGQMSMLFTDNKDSVFGILSALKVDSGENKKQNKNLPHRGLEPASVTRLVSAPLLKSCSSFPPPVAPDVLSQFSIHVHIVIS